MFAGRCDQRIRAGVGQNRREFCSRKSNHCSATILKLAELGLQLYRQERRIDEEYLDAFQGPPFRNAQVASLLIDVIGANARGVHRTLEAV